MKKFRIMKRKSNWSLFILLIVFMAACSPKIKTVIVNKAQPLAFDENIALLDIHHSRPQSNIVKIGELKLGDKGLTNKCDFNTLMILAKSKAREHGANIAKVVEKIAPDNFTTTCYTLKIVLYKYDGDVTKWPQYEITIL